MTIQRLETCVLRLKVRIVSALAEEIAGCSFETGPPRRQSTGILVVDDPTHFGSRKTTAYRGNSICLDSTAVGVVSGSCTEPKLSEAPGSDAAINAHANSVTGVALARSSHIAIEMRSAGNELGRHEVLASAKWPIEFTLDRWIIAEIRGTENARLVCILRDDNS